MKRLFIIVFVLLTTLSAFPRQPERGYRGFVEWSNNIRSEKFGGFDLAGNINTWRENVYYKGFTTSHGYQINPMFFIGAGLGMEKCGKLNNWIAPIFLQGRADFKFGKFTPFGDIRLGANLAEGVGAYFSPTIGYRFNWGRKMGVNLGLGLSLAGYKVEYWEGTFNGLNDYDLYYVGTRRHTRAYFSFRLGFDF